MQSHAENAIYRFKKIIGGRLKSKHDKAQKREAMMGCAIWNRMLEIGRPVLLNSLSGSVLHVMIDSCTNVAGRSSLTLSADGPGHRIVRLLHACDVIDPFSKKNLAQNVTTFIYAFKHKETQIWRLAEVGA